MTDIGEAIGDAAQGALLARAVEPTHGEAHGHTHESACLNCGTALVGPHCHACGQAAHVHRTIGAFFHDLLHGAFHFEGKIWRTLPLLALRPGKLTREYIDGRRASYVSPIALFLFAVFVMFAATGLSGGVRIADRTEQGLSVSVRENEKTLAALERQRASVAAAGGATAQLDRQIAEARQSLGLLRTVADKGMFAGGAARLSDDVPPEIGEKLRHVAANPDLFIYKLKNSAYKFSWALIPLSVPLVWLLFPFSRRFGVYDHTVFVTYSLAFMSLVVSVDSVATGLGLGAITVVLIPLAAGHMFVQLRGAYGLSNSAALWRTAALALFAMIALSLFVVALVALGVFE